MGRINPNKHLEDQNPTYEEIHKMMVDHYVPLSDWKGEGVYVLELGPLEDLRFPKWKIKKEYWNNFLEYVGSAPDGCEEEDDIYIFRGTLNNYEHLAATCLKEGWLYQHEFGLYLDEIKRILKSEKIVYVGKFSGATPEQRIMAHIRNNPVTPQVAGSKFTRAFKVKRLMEIRFCGFGESEDVESDVAQELREKHPNWYVWWW